MCSRHLSIYVCRVVAFYSPEVTDHSGPPSGDSECFRTQLLTQAEPRREPFPGTRDSGPNRVICIQLWWWRVRNQHREWPWRRRGAVFADVAMGPGEGDPELLLNRLFGRLHKPIDKLPGPREPLLLLACCCFFLLRCCHLQPEDPIAAADAAETESAEEQTCACDADHQSQSEELLCCG